MAVLNFLWWVQQRFWCVDFCESVLGCWGRVPSAPHDPFDPELRLANFGTPFSLQLTIGFSPLPLASLPALG